QSLRISKAYIFDRHAYNTTRDIERWLSGIQHPAQIVERSVRIRAAHRLVQCADQIVVAILRLVVDRRASLHDLLQFGRAEDFILACGSPDLLGQGQRGTTITVGHALERFASFGIKW